MVSIQFNRSVDEKRLPVVRLTKSKNGMTGTATFLFIKPFILENFLYVYPAINGMYLIWENNEIATRDIEIIFRDGKPFIIKSIFIFKNANEWFSFLQFMTLYSKETGLSFNSAP